MSENELTSELKKLKLELQAIKASQNNASASDVSSDDLDETCTETATGEREPPCSAEEKSFNNQLEELAHLLEKELRELPAVTCLAVFSLGILLGRLLR